MIFPGFTVAWPGLNVVFSIFYAFLLDTKKESRVALDRTKKIFRTLPTFFKSVIKKSKANFFTQSKKAPTESDNHLLIWDYKNRLSRFLLMFSALRWTFQKGVSNHVKRF